MFRGKQLERHLSKIEAHLDDDESVIFSAFSTIVTNGELGTDGGALVVTSARVIFSGSAPLLGTNSTVSLTFDELNGVSTGQRMLKSGLIQPYLELNAGGAAYFFNMNPNDASEARSAITSAKGNSQKRDASSNGSSRLDELEKLGALLERGLLTKDEFELEKKRVLNSRD